MKADSNTEKKPGTNASVKIDTNAFIRQVSVAGTDEELPKGISSSKQEEMNTSINEESNTSLLADEEKIKGPINRKRRQSGPVDYESVFLNRNELRNRQGLYIDKDNYEILQTLVRSIRNERLSVSGLVDNIVRHHIELYEDEISRIYEENSKNPIKRK